MQLTLLYVHRVRHFSLAQKHSPRRAHAPGCCPRGRLSAARPRCSFARNYVARLTTHSRKSIPLRALPITCRHGSSGARDQSASKAAPRDAGGGGGAKRCLRCSRNSSSDGLRAARHENQEVPVVSLRRVRSACFALFV